MVATRSGAFTSLVVLTLAGCNPATDQESFATRDSAGIVIAENGMADLLPQCPMNPEPVIQIGTDDGTAEYELYRVFGATRLGDGRIVLVNDGTKELRFYDAGGRFLRRAGRGGEGPGEFSNAFYLWRLPGDSLLVGNYRPWQYHLFSPEGSFQRTVTPVPHYLNSPALMGMLADGRPVLSSRDGIAEATAEYRMRYVTVVVHTPDGTAPDTLGTFPNGRWGRAESNPTLTLFPLFESFTRMTVGGRWIVMAHTSVPELTVYEAAEGTPRVTQIIRWTTPDRRVTSADISAERTRLATENPDMSEEMRRMLVEPLISPTRPVAEVFPAFSTILLGRDDRFWVREYPPAAQPQAPNRWMVFSPEGRLICGVSVPRGSTILEAGADYFLTHDRDTLGVERVAMYRLENGQ